MTPNAVSACCRPSRRGFLVFTAFATAAVAGGMPLLTARGRPGSGARGGTT
ncbi:MULTISPECIES: hypothetical protein [Streptomyces]|uniref:hypothetical protein n=1 Tax=Streptomyces TaxID=1883 RepID=UPI00130230A2|nr:MULTISPECIES: hypothetical protein [Streptomyces]MYU30570.1 hypothetical protein [Streptomyces sp. SID7810]